MAQNYKQDSNNTDLRYAEESSLGVLPAAASQIWYPLEPNSYSDFGGQIKTKARNPINKSRQNRKGSVVDLDASGGYNTDLTTDNWARIAQGFQFADAREKFDSIGLNASTVVSGVVTSDDSYRLSKMNLSGIIAGHVIFASDFTNAGNNGLKTVASFSSVAATGTLTTSTNPSNSNTITIGTKVYTFQTSLTNVDGNVKIGASETATLLNFQNAVNASGGVPGTDYALATTAHPDVIASGAGAHTVTITARVKGTYGNAIATTDTLAAGGDGFAAATLTTGASNVVVNENLTDETPTSAARIQTVGYQFGSATASIDVSGTRPKLSRASGSVDWTTIGVIPGEWVFLGEGATVAEVTSYQFVNSANNGFARVYSVSPTEIVFDKTTGTMVTDAGTGKTIRMYFGKVIKNESNPDLIKRRSYSIERDLGKVDTALSGRQGEYLNGSIANQMVINIKQADLITIDFSFVSTDYVTRTQSDNLKSVLAAAAGSSAVNTPALTQADAFNTSSDISRLRLTPVSTNSNPSALFAYVTEATITVNNNVTPNKAVAKLGAFDCTAGQFDVSGKVTAYFASVEAVAAVRNNTDATFDVAAVANNRGVLIDLPFLGLGDGRLSVEQNQPITLPLDMNAAAHPTFDHTLLINFFNYLPDSAEADVVV